MIKTLIIIQLHLFMMLIPSFQNKDEVIFSLSVKVSDLRNSNGVVQFALYNDEDSFPDEHYKKYYLKQTAKIINGRSEVTFKDLPPGKYAVNILHDENEDGKVKKGIILPKEGIGFSNYESIGLSNRPSFQKASFNLAGDKKIEVKIIYM